MKFSIRQKILAIFGVLILIAVFIGIQSIRRFNFLGKSIDVILRENYKSVIACQQMKEALERTDSGILFIMTGQEQEGKELITENVNKFNTALEVELNNLTLPEEPKKAFLVKELFNLFQEELKHITGQEANPSLARDTYFKTLFPLFQKIKDTIDDIFKMNQQNMYDANQRARVRAARAKDDMYVFLLLCSIIALLFMFFSNRWLLRPIHRLIDSTNEISKGNLNLVVEIDSHDEIGQLSESFNTMAENLRFFKRIDHSKFLRVQRSIQEVFRKLPEAIAIINTEGTIELSTKSAQANFNLIPDSRIIDNPHAWLAHLFFKIRKSTDIIDQEQKQEIIQHFINTKERFFQPEVFPIHSDQQELQGFLFILEDVTLLQQSDEIKRNLLSTVSHQLKTPLTSVRMAIHLLLDEKIGILNKNQAELLVAAQEETERLNGIIEDLLDISRIESGKVKMNLSSVSPKELISEGIEAFRREAQEKGIEIVIDLLSDLPDVMADKARMYHVFSNVMSNAINYTPFDGKIILTAQSDDEKVQFSITDTGIGIPEMYQPTIFNKFYRVPGQKDNGGEGLGLAIAKEIIEAHGGEISFVSTEGKGTTFTFTLKRYDIILKGKITNA